MINTIKYYTIKFNKPNIHVFYSFVSYNNYPIIRIVSHTSILQYVLHAYYIQLLYILHILYTMLHIII